MDERWNEIPMPTEAEKDAAVAQILDAGLPVRTGLWHTLTQTLQAVGLRTLFFGEADCLFLSALCLLLCLLPAAAAAARQAPWPDAVLLSPDCTRRSSADMDGKRPSPARWSGVGPAGFL